VTYPQNHHFTLSPEQLDTFARDGVLHLPGILSSERLAAARAQVLAPLERLDLWKHGAWAPAAEPRPVWPQKGLKARDAVGHKHPAVAALLQEPALAAAIDQLLGGREHDTTMHPRPQVLFTQPLAPVWNEPPGWHSDAPRLPSGESLGVQLFGCLDRVAPGGGGTLLAVGSHRLFDEGRGLHGPPLTRRVRSTALFQLHLDLWSDPGAPLPAAVIDGWPVRIIEAIGEPGDVWLTDMRLFHAGVPNFADTPRLMVTHRYQRKDLLAEAQAVYGWT
jgi:hypothetical protein